MPSVESHRRASHRNRGVPREKVTIARAHAHWLPGDPRLKQHSQTKNARHEAAICCLPPPQPCGEAARPSPAQHTQFTCLFLVSERSSTPTPIITC